MVGVDQAQIDKILSGASSEDPEARLETLEKELDFVKTSIKRLLIDLRERMNELDNPFTTAAASYAGNRFEPPDPAGDAAGEGDKEPEHDSASAGMSGQPKNPVQESLEQDSGLFPADLRAAQLSPGVQLPSGAQFPPADMLPPVQAKPAGKLKLQKVHRLFEWVHQGCRKYGHEHMAIMIDAYQSMGYIDEDVSDQIHDIMRMAPETPGDFRDIGPNEFVSELYVLNRILDPDDSTLDRDMIEVLMLAPRRPGDRNAEKTSSEEQDAGDTWIELLDRI
ncbi:MULTISPECIES: FlaD/FlaE family flagellar protein [unclassified Methanoculleus]|uniref:FlaD/FlaE family flagellar protein n=1 Tax=unclassified Methanoculleus TaxID=2619537 RepID=UPI0025D31826|nr:MULTISPECIES: FlaD/FlaE family flagellar protein [unclassified Methanoculleus]